MLAQQKLALYGEGLINQFADDIDYWWDCTGSVPSQIMYLQFSCLLVLIKSTFTQSINFFLGLPQNGSYFQRPVIWNSSNMAFHCIILFLQNLTIVTHSMRFPRSWQIFQSNLVRSSSPAPIFFRAVSISLPRSASVLFLPGHPPTLIFGVLSSSGTLFTWPWPYNMCDLTMITC